MQFFSKIVYISELILCQMIFLYGYPKRKGFAWRLPVAVIASGIIEYLLRMIEWHIPVFVFFRMLVTIAVTVAAMFFVFKGSFLSVLSACVAGVAVQHIGHHISKIIAMLPFFGKWNVIMEFISVVILAAALFPTAGRFLAKNRYYENYDKRMIAVSIIIILVVIGITRFARVADLNLYIQLAISLYAIICCIMALFIQLFLHNFTILKSNYYVLQRINEEEKKQYNLSRTNTELLNIKCHDLKHFLLSRKNLPEEESRALENIIETYDNLYKTGSDALDIILNEKSLYCKKSGISLSFMGDGKNFDFMSVMDIYSMFGNILENAIEAAEKLETEAKKTISIVAKRQGDMICVNCVNFFKERLPAFDGSLLPTTKKSGAGFHGYGLKSIRSIAEKYGGGIGIDTDGDVFILNVYMIR